MTFLDESKLPHSKNSVVFSHTPPPPGAPLMACTEFGFLEKPEWKMAPAQQRERQVQFGIPLLFLSTLNFCQVVWCFTFSSSKSSN